MFNSSPMFSIKLIQILKNATVSTPRDKVFLQDVLNAIYTNMNDEQFSAAQLANKLYLTSSQVNRKLNTIVQQPAGQFIRQIRLEYAALLLSKTTESIGAIAFNVGYKNQAHFCSSFKQYFGVTPSKYIRKTEKCMNKAKRSFLEEKTKHTYPLPLH